MRIHVLGSAAGGGVPQWNCGCPNCRAARLNSSRGCPRRTQSSVAVSHDGKRWVLLNASPDLCSQFASFPALAPSRGNLRGSPLDAVVLTDGEMDHVAGLLSLREQKNLRLICTRKVLNLLNRDFPILPALGRYFKVQHSGFPVRMSSLHLEAIDVSGKTPPYAHREAQKGDVTGLRIKSAKNGKTLVYLPCLLAITRKIREFVEGCDCLLVDGTFWSNDEMTSLGLTKRTAQDMGHLPMSGDAGSLAWLADLKVKRRIYIHINNTNPVLRKGSREEKMVQRAGVEIAYDGMDFRL